MVKTGWATTFSQNSSPFSSVLSEVETMAEQVKGLSIS
jgi:hypothetical protein